MPLDPATAPEAEGRSILVYGDAPSPVVWLGAALAARSATPIAWADASGPAARLPTPARARLLQLVEGPLVERFDAEDFTVAPVPLPAEARVVDPASLAPELQQRLGRFLTLPKLLQALAARTSSDGGAGAVLLTGLEAIPPGYLERLVLSEEVHRVLHGEAISLVATYLGTPSDSLRRPFAFEHEVRARDGRPWAEALVRSGARAGEALSGFRRPLRDLWRREGLDGVLELPEGP